MQDQSYFNWVAGVAVALVLVVAVVSFVVVPSGAIPTRSAGGAQAGPTVYRNLSISFDPTTGAYSYNVGHIEVPLHTTVVFTITNFDASAAALPSPADANVAGTAGGMMQVTSAAGAVSVAKLPAGDVSHTFSMSDPLYKMNVPIPRASGPASPIVVQFSAVFNYAGTFEWGCVVLCGTQDMGGSDSMYGTLTAS
jgi:hypothetical protein